MSGYRIDIDGELPISGLIRSRMEALGLRKVDLARRMGYQTSVEKGIRRLDALLAGELRKYSNLRYALAAGLDVAVIALDQVVADTRHIQWARDDREYRRGFTPHIIWDTEFWVPRPIAIAGFVGAQRALYFHPTSENPADWSEEAAASCPMGIPCYGVARGFWVNYSPDCAVHFNKQGEPDEVLGKAVRPGIATALVGSRPTNWSEVTRQRERILKAVDWSPL